MECYGVGVGAVRAFELLRKLSQDSNVPLLQIAKELVDNAQSES
jgi:AmiR/NasT family two-component response regulator